MAKIKDYSEDDSTHTLKIITDVTEEGCTVNEREYKFVDEDTLEVKHATEITLECDTSDLEELVYRSLEDLREECDGDMEFDI